jgi:hypothetical protein
MINLPEDVEILARRVAAVEHTSVEDAIRRALVEDAIRRALEDRARASSESCDATRSPDDRRTDGRARG